MKGSIFLWDEEEWGSLRGLGRNDMTSLEVFFDEGFTSIFLGRVEQIDFDNLGNKGVLEVNGVIKRSVRRKLFVGLLEKDIGKVSAEFRNGYLLGFFCLGNFH